MPRLNRPARTSDPELAPLYRERRKLATKCNGSGLPAMRAWSQLEALESRLRRLDPDGEWRYEGREFGASSWHVDLPAVVA